MSRAFAALALCLLAGCSRLDRYESRIEVMNRSLEGGRNAMLLLNILRAGLGHPMTFMSVTNINGTQGIDATISAPTATWSGAALRLTEMVVGGNSATAALSGSIGVTPLETREFYQGILAPISLPTAQFLLTQGYPRQILFNLFIESVRIQHNKSERLLWNDPMDPVYPEFQAFLRGMIDAGVTLEAVPSGGREAGRRVNPAPNVPSEPPQLHARFCFDRGLTTPSPEAGPFCGASGPDGLHGLPGAPNVEFRLRSTYSVFRYLGRLVEPEIGDRVRLTTQRVGGIVLGEDTKLLPLSREVPSVGCLAETNFLGDFWCIPARGAEQGAQILQLLTQLLALNISVRDLPALPTVRVTN
jgi:hypothetical protein